MSNTKTNNLIPYIIMEANSCKKKPFITYKKGFIEEDIMKVFLLDKLVEFVYKLIDIDNFQTIKDVETFWNCFDCNSYLDNKPWDCFVIRNNLWENIYFTNEEIYLEVINKKDSFFYISSDDDEDF